MIICYILWLSAVLWDFLYTPCWSVHLASPINSLNVLNNFQIFPSLFSFCFLFLSVKVSEWILMTAPLTVLLRNVIGLCQGGWPCSSGSRMTSSQTDNHSSTPWWNSPEVRSGGASTAGCSPTFSPDASGPRATCTMMLTPFCGQGRRGGWHAKRLRRCHEKEEDNINKKCLWFIMKSL